MSNPVFSPTRSAAIKNQLMRLSTAETRQRTPKRRPIFALAASALLVLGLAGGANMAASHAHATEKLNDLAQVSIHYRDQELAPHQYLKVTERGLWANCTTTEAGTDSCTGPKERTNVVYKPATDTRAWAIERIEKERPEYDHVIHAKNGAFYGTDMKYVDELLAHATTGDELYAYINSTYAKGSASRAENNFVRLTDALATGFIPAQKRAAFYDALTRISGVTVTENVQTHDGRTGIAIGRTEPLRVGERLEIIIDPNTGQVIGRRNIQTIAVMGYGVNEISGQSTLEYGVVNTVPTATEEPTPADQTGELTP